MASVADFDDIRELGFASISGSYASVGSATTKRMVGICFINDTEGSMMFTNDVTKDKVFVKAGSFILWDCQANMNTQKDDSFLLAIGTQWSVKQLAAPVSGSVYICGLVHA